MSLLPLKLALRSLRRAPAFTTTAVLTLGLGIGAVCATFTVLNAVLLRPLPYAHSDRLVGMWYALPGFGASKVNQSLGTYFFNQREAKAFDAMAVYDQTAVNLSDASGGPPQRVRAASVSVTLLPTLEVQPMLGRNFSDAEDRPGGPPVVLIGEGLWRRRFGGDRSVIGQTIEVDRAKRTIIGILPQGFRFPSAATELWLPMALDPAATEAGGFGHDAVGRIRAGTSLSAAQAELQQLLTRLPEAYPTLGPGIPTEGILTQGKARALLYPMRDDVVGDFGRVLWIITGTAALVLLVACVNVANLLLARTEGRQREMAVRAALGADRWRVLGHFLTEGSVLAAVGGTLGVVLATVSIGLLVRFGPTELPRLQEVGIDGTSLGIALVATAAVAVLCSSLPALRYSRTQLGAVLSEEGRGGTAGRGRQRARGMLVAAQVALSLVLLAGSGLLVRSVGKLRSVRLGFDPSQVLTLRLALPDATYPHVSDNARFYGQLVEHIEQLPGVAAIGVTSKLPLRPDGSDLTPLYVEDQMPAEGALPPVFELVTASAGYFSAAGIPLLAGHTFDRDVSRQSPHEVIVSRAFVEQYWRDGFDHAIGRRVRAVPNGDWATIVGVVESVRDTSIQTPAEPVVYFPTVAVPDSVYPHVRDEMAVVVRARGVPTPLVPAIVQEVKALDPSLPVFEVSEMRDVVAASMARLSFTLLILAVAAGISLLLGAIGLYGVIAYVVSLRTREIGVRIALGAQPGDVSRLVARQGLLLALAGTALGLIAFTIVSRFLRALLYDVSPTDPLTLVAVSVLLLVVAGLSSWIPAHRAAAISPLEALRSD